MGKTIIHKVEGKCKECKQIYNKISYNQIFCSIRCRTKCYLKLKKYPPCFICLFDKITEKHHFMWKSFDGEDTAENIINLCPNHHRMVHNEKYKEEVEKLIAVKLLKIVNQNSLLYSKLSQMIKHQ